MPRLYTEQPLQADTTIGLPAGAARHVQVLRLQPGASLTLFNGEGGEWQAIVHSIGRSEVQVRVQTHDAVERELPHRIVLAIGMPANERMDALIEKATELGVSSVQPLTTERSVLRLSGERAEKRIAHWQAVAVAACEQSGRTRLPLIQPVRHVSDWLSSGLNAEITQRFVLDPRATASLNVTSGSAVFLSGPEGGLTDAEVDAARLAGFAALSLGSRVLRADTAPLAVLAHWALSN